MPDQLTIPGEPALAGRVRQAAARDALPHAVILSGRGDLLRSAPWHSMAADRPCGTCPACRKVLRDIHPDVIQVEDPDHKMISMDVLRQVRSDAYVLPNEGRRKIYLFPDCGRLDGKGQNVLLKVLEEGPPHAAFLFCAANSAVLLQTIRSRAVEWKLSPPVEEAADADGGARALCELLCGGKPADIAGYCAGLENSKMDREALGRLLSDARDLVSRGLAACYGAGAEDELSRRLAREAGRRKLAAWAEILDRFSRQCAYNIGVGHLTGALAAELIG